jgi:DNA topoisomerase-3
MEKNTMKGTTILTAGWMKYDDGGQKDKLLPDLAEGDAVNIAFAPIEKETTPPKHYTIETLNQYLKNPFREEKAELKEKEENGEMDDDTEEYRAMLEGVELGTEATRTSIIDNARRSKYIDLKKDVYTILPGGIHLIESLEDMHISMDKYKTCEMGRSLKKVFRGAISVEESVAFACDEIAAVFHTADAEEKNSIGFFGDEVGECPLCHSRVRRTSFGYGCAGYKEKGCRFGIRMKILGNLIPKSLASTLLTEKKTPVLSGFISQKTGKPFDAMLTLDEQGRVGFAFPPREVDTIPFVPPIQ